VETVKKIFLVIGAFLCGSFLSYAVGYPSMLLALRWGLWASAVAAAMLLLALGWLWRRQQEPGRRTFFRVMLIGAAFAACVVVFVATPAFLNAVLNSIEQSTRGNLFAMRSALSNFQGENDGRAPKGLDALVDGQKYLYAIAKAKLPPHHPDSDKVRPGSAPDDTGGWLYDSDIGNVWVNCTHTDRKGQTWAEY